MNIFEREKEVADIARLIAALTERSEYEKALNLIPELEDKLADLILDK